MSEREKQASKQTGERERETSRERAGREREREAERERAEPTKACGKLQVTLACDSVTDVLDTLI